MFLAGDTEVGVSGRGPGRAPPGGTGPGPGARAAAWPGFPTRVSLTEPTRRTRNHPRADHTAERSRHSAALSSYMAPSGSPWSHGGGGVGELRKGPRGQYLSPPLCVPFPASPSAACLAPHGPHLPGQAGASTSPRFLWACDCQEAHLSVILAPR